MAQDAPVPHVYLSPTVGIISWDDNALPVGTFDSQTSPAFGLRFGYAPVSAFSGEFVALTTSNEATYAGQDGGPQTQADVRLVQLELSFLVNFQTLIRSRVYPFLDLGLGSSLRSGGQETSDGGSADLTKVSFHLGGGIKWDVSPRVALRANFRDTFFTETRGSGDLETQVTVDSIELTLGLDYRIPLGSGGGDKNRLR